MDASPPTRPPRRARHFVTGLLTLIPLGVTVFILVWLVHLLSAIGRYPALQIRRLVSETFHVDAPWVNSPWLLDFSAVVVVLTLIYFLGLMTNNFIGRQFLILFEGLLSRIPFVKTVYGAVKKTVDLMRHDDGEDAHRVVLIDFPSPEMKAVGLLTRTFPDAVTGRLLAAVFVPTTPNPTNGYLEIVPMDRVTRTTWTFDEAMSFVVSGGAIAPDQIHYEKSDPSIHQSGSS